MEHKTLVECRFDLSSIYPGAFGTADAVTYFPELKLLRVYDLKYGAGISVDVENNKQLQYYALGALLSMKDARVDEVEVVIVQPRCDHPDGPVRRWRFKALELLDVAADIYDDAKRTEDPNAPLNPGPHCRFCPAAPQKCPRLREKALALAQNEFSPAFSYDPEELSKALTNLPLVEAWIKNVREFAYGEALHGRVPPGFKLVAKRATRKWKDEDAAVKFIEANTRLPFEQIFDTKVKSPAQLEKLVHKNQREALSELMVAESSGYNLSPESDKRPAIKGDPASEFGAVEDEMFN